MTSFLRGRSPGDRGAQTAAALQISSGAEDPELIKELTETSHKGIGVAPGHHGEILQGVFHGREGRKHRGLVTLPFPMLQSIGWASRLPHNGIAIDPPAKSKAASAVGTLLARYGHDDRKGVAVRVRSSIPERYGLGSSTADIVAALRCVSDTLGLLLSPEEELAIAVSAEAASDGIMFVDRAYLVAHREGRVLEGFADTLPPLGLMSVNNDPDNPVETLGFTPARYEDAEIEEFGRLRRRLRNAIEAGDLCALAEVASCSAAMNERHLPQPHFEDIRFLARRCGAHGLQVAHSGRMIGIIFPPDLEANDRRVLMVAGGLRELGLLPTFYTRVEAARAAA